MSKLHRQREREREIEGKRQLEYPRLQQLQLVVATFKLLGSGAIVVVCMNVIGNPSEILRNVLLVLPTLE